jgi:hypothetical protein
LRDRLVRECAGVLRRLPAAARAEGDFAFSARPFGEPAADASGFLALKRLLKWGSEQALAEGQSHLSLDRALTLVRLGEFLRGGDASAATTGLQAESEGCALVAGVVRQGPRELAAEALKALAQGSDDRVDRAIANEAERSLATLEHLRKLVAQEDWAGMESVVGVLTASRLAGLQALGRDAREEAFQELAGQASLYADWLASASARPTSKRGGPPARESNACSALWPHVTRGLDALVRLNDRVLAERRIVTVLAWSSSLASRPADIGRAPAGSRSDPYTGAPLGFRRTADGILPYSVGEDLRDDGGDPGQDIVVAGR